MIEVRNLYKTYKPKKGKAVEALKNISLKFEDKGLVFILGKSGSGKSTLLNMLGGLDKFDAGEIIIKGKSSSDFTQSDFDSYRNTFIGFIFQEYNILNDFTVGANIALSMELQGKKPTKEALNSILDEVDLTGFASRKPNELSGGQKQRVAIARALIKNPEIIMADEPTGALDSNTGKQVFDTLKKLSKDKLVIVVSHDREFAEQYGDRVIELADGEIISDIKKYVAKASSVSDGIDIIEDKLIHIKSGYELTENDLKMINDYLKQNTDSDSFISIDSKTNDDIRHAAKIDDSGNREAFHDTTDESLDIPDYSPDDFKLIRSRLPLHNSLKMALGSLKKKPFRLIMTIILSTVAFTLFGLVNTMSTYDPVKSGTDSIIDSNVNYTAFTKEVANNDYGTTYYTQQLLTDDDVDRISKKFPKLTFNKVISPMTADLTIENLFNTDAIHADNYSTYYTTMFSGVVHATDSTLSDMDYKITGRLPEKDNEVAITSIAAESFIKAGYRKDEKQEKAIDIKLESDLIGKTLSLSLCGYKEFTITGIIDTGYDGDRYSEYKEEHLDSTLSLKDYIMLSEKNVVDAYSYHTMLFTSENIFNEIADSNIGVLCHGDSYGVNFYDNTVNYNWYDVSYLAEYRIINDTIKSNMVLFDESKELGPTDIVIPLSLIAGNADASLTGKLFGTIQNNGSTLTEENIAAIKTAIIENMDSLKSFPITMECGSSANEWNYTTKTMNVAGVYVDIDSQYYRLAILHDGFFKEANISDDGKYKAIIADMPSDKNAVTEIVKYSLDNGVKDMRYPLNNCTSYMVSNVNDIISTIKPVFLYTGIFFAVFAALMLMNFITTSISYKKREIGILRAVGARGTDVFKIFFNESLIIALINWLLSIIVTGVIVLIINTTCRSTYTLSITILHFGIIQLILMLIISTGVAFIASFIPVYKVSKKKPIEVIRKN